MSALSLDGKRRGPKHAAPRPSLVARIRARLFPQVTA